MKRSLFIVLACVVCFIIEFLLFNYVSPWLRPSLIIILLVFADIFWNVRSAVLVALVGGMLEDSFGMTFGFNMVAYSVCVLAASFLGDYIYQKGSRSSLVVLLFFVLGVNVLVRFLLLAMVDQGISVGMVLSGITVDIVVTLLVANITFNGLIRCALKLYA
ncbi:MAG: hypothetical protein HQL25_05355 [Candidatus Omnitrophica bacterium]|nr:hypothetical protein [Candidatus Omnitrophota bacterium]